MIIILKSKDGNNLYLVDVFEDEVKTSPNKAEAQRFETLPVGLLKWLEGFFEVQVAAV